MSLKRYVFVIAGMILFMRGVPLMGSAANIYIAQNAAGGANGADCANAYAYTFFNASSNWGTAANQIGPGTTVHLCGTFTAPAGTSKYLAFQGSGSSGNLITLHFEDNAVITAPYWSGPAIVAGKSYIVVDGGTNGTIQATANGTALANQQDNGTCVNNGSPAESFTNLTVQNLTCANLYVNSSPADNGGESTYGIDIWNASNVTITKNTIHDAKWAIRQSFGNGGTYSTETITNNTIYNMDHGYFMSDSSASGSAVMAGLYIYNNTLGSMTQWDNTANYNHHDWIHLNTNSTATRFSNIYVYNNYAYGDIGANANAGFFSYPAATAAMSGVYFFNNVYVNTSSNHCWANGFISWFQAGVLTAVNNTFISATSSCNDNGVNYGGGSPSLTYENNILQNAKNNNIYSPSGSAAAIDYNDYYGGGSWYWSSTYYTGLSNWKSGTGFDAHGIAGNPSLDASYGPNAGSPVIQTGMNLYSTCNGQARPGLGALCYDKAGVARPSSGAWDIGAYQADQALSPATGLTATPH